MLFVGRDHMIARPHVKGDGELLIGVGMHLERPLGSR